MRSKNKDQTNFRNHSQMKNKKIIKQSIEDAFSKIIWWNSITCKNAFNIELKFVGFGIPLFSRKWQFRFVKKHFVEISCSLRRRPTKLSFISKLLCSPTVGGAEVRGVRCEPVRLDLMLKLLWVSLFPLFYLFLLIFIY